MQRKRKRISRFSAFSSSWTRWSPVDVDETKFLSADSLEKTPCCYLIHSKRGFSALYSIKSRKTLAIWRAAVHPICFCSFPESEDSCSFLTFSPKKNGVFLTLVQGNKISHRNLTFLSTQRPIKKMITNRNQRNDKCHRDELLVGIDTRGKHCTVLSSDGIYLRNYKSADFHCQKFLDVLLSSKYFCLCCCASGDGLIDKIAVLSLDGEFLYFWRPYNWPEKVKIVDESLYCLFGPSENRRLEVWNLGPFSAVFQQDIPLDLPYSDFHVDQDRIFHGLLTNWAVWSQKLPALDKV